MKKNKINLANVALAFLSLTFLISTVEARDINGSNRGEVLRGTSSGDRIYGQGGNDTIYGGGGNDQLNGNSGNDRMRGDNGTDRGVGGPGWDGANTVESGSWEKWLNKYLL